MASRTHDPEQHVMSFGDHLEELRMRFFLALALPLPLWFVTFYFSDTLLDWLVLPLTRVLAKFDLPTRLQSLSPPEALLAQLRLSLIAALILSGPWILWQGWQFIRPGLYEKERRFVYLLLPGSAVLTACGVALMYWIMLPLMLFVLVGIGTSMQMSPSQQAVDPAVQAILEQHQTVEVRYEQPESPPAGELWILWPRFQLYASVPDDKGGVRVVEVPHPAESYISQEFHLSKYISFVLLLFLGIVIAFQMPLVVLLLGWIGLASVEWLKRNRKYALLVLGFISAIITPADVVSMLMMLAPLYGLYELGILLLIIAPASKVAEGRVFTLRGIERKKRKAADKSSPDKAEGDDSQSAEPAQPDETIARTPSAPESQSKPPEEGDRD